MHCVHFIRRKNYQDCRKRYTRVNSYKKIDLTFVVIVAIISSVRTGDSTRQKRNLLSYLELLFHGVTVSQWSSFGKTYYLISRQRHQNKNI